MKPIVETHPPKMQSLGHPATQLLSHPITRSSKQNSTQSIKFVWVLSFYGNAFTCHTSYVIRHFAMQVTFTYKRHMSYVILQCKRIPYFIRLGGNPVPYSSNMKYLSGFCRNGRKNVSLQLQLFVKKRVKQHKTNSAE